MKSTTRKVTFNIPGIRRMGEYEPGKVYEVEAEEAARLVKDKGFEYVAAAKNGGNDTNKTGKGD